MPAKKPADDPVQISATMWDNPYIKGVAWAIAGAITIATSAVGGYAMAMDKEYVRKVALDEVKQELVAQNTRQEVANKQLNQQMEYQSDRNRKRGLEDHLFKFDMTPEKQRTQTDRALAAKYKQEIQEMNDRWNKAGTPLK